MLYIPFELSFERFSFKARLPAGVRENEPTLKLKSPQTGIQGQGSIEVRIKSQGHKYNPAYIQLNLPYMKPEMYTFT